MRWLATALVVCATACGQAVATSPQPTTAPASPVASGFVPVPGVTPLASPTPPAVTSLAVLVDLFTGTSSYDIALVAGDGRVVAREHPGKRTPIDDAAQLPYVSASNSRLYYLDGDGDIRYVKPDGSGGLATSVPGGAKVHAAFAVSPDDARIAVTLLDYSVDPVLLTLYVEDLVGAHHAVIFTSTTKYIWPVAWRSGQIVVANYGAAPFVSQAIAYTNGDRLLYPYGPNPYNAISYHVIDPVTAVREVIVGGGGVSGLLSRAGSAMVQAGIVDWTGAYRPVTGSPYAMSTAVGSLSPNGHGIATAYSDGRLIIIDDRGYVRELRDLGAPLDWVGWLDGSHLVTGFYQRADGTPSVIDIGYVAEANVNLDKATPVDAHGIVAAILPGGLEP